MIGTITYYGAQGATSTLLPALNFVTILKVIREGKVYRKVETTPGSLEFRYSGSRLRFSVPYSGPGPTDPETISSFEKVKVIYKI